MSLRGSRLPVTGFSHRRGRHAKAWHSEQQGRGAWTLRDPWGTAAAHEGHVPVWATVKKEVHLSLNSQPRQVHLIRESSPLSHSVPLAHGIGLSGPSTLQVLVPLSRSDRLRSALSLSPTRGETEAVGLHDLSADTASWAEAGLDGLLTTRPTSPKPLPAPSTK